MAFTWALIWLKARALCASSSASDFHIICERPVGEVDDAVDVFDHAASRHLEHGIGVLADEGADELRAYKLAFAKTALASLDSVKSRLQAMHEKGEKIESLRGLYDMWVDGSEEAYAEFAMSDEYQVVYGDLVNSLMQVRKDLNELAEHQYELMNIPTRSEIDTMQHRQQENRREGRQLRHEIALLRAQVERLSAQPPAASSPPARTRAKAISWRSPSILDCPPSSTAGTPSPTCTRTWPAPNSARRRCSTAGPAGPAGPAGSPTSV